MPAGQGNETHRYQVSRGCIAILILSHQDKILNREGASHGDDHPAVIPQRFYEGRWNMTCRCGDDDGIKRCVLIPAVVAVADCRFNIMEAQIFQKDGSRLCQFSDNFDCVNMLDDGGKDRGLVALSRAHFQNPAVLSQVQNFSHVRHNIRLGDGLSISNGHVAVVIGPV